MKITKIFSIVLFTITVNTLIIGASIYSIANHFNLIRMQIETEVKKDYDEKTLKLLSKASNLELELKILKSVMNQKGDCNE